MAVERFLISGRLGTTLFVPWVERHGRRLGLAVEVRSASAEEVALVVEGPEALIDAMEMGCLLGPIEAWVDAIERTQANAAAR